MARKTQVRAGPPRAFHATPDLPRALNNHVAVSALAWTIGLRLYQRERYLARPALLVIPFERFRPLLDAVRRSRHVPRLPVIRLTIEQQDYPDQQHRDQRSEPGTFRFESEFRLQQA